MWARLRRFSSLPRPAKTIFLRAAALLPLISISLRLRGFRSTQNFLQNFVTNSLNAANDASCETCVKLTTRMVLAATRNSPVPSTCLERSLALWWLLARQGIATQIRIGVRKDGEKFAAHAWVERDGVAIGEPETPHLHYAAFVDEISGVNS